MVKWRYCLVLAVLLLLPSRTGSKREEDEDDENNEDDNDDDDNDEDYEEEEGGDKSSSVGGRRAPPVQLHTTNGLLVTRTTKKRPLECYVCLYKSDTPLRACLDPIKHRVHTMTCHSVDDKCFTSVVSKESNSYDSVIRGCRSACVGTTEVTCCELNRCNHQAFAMPTLTAPKVLTSKATKSVHSSVLFFVTVLLVLQTVVKVSFV